MERTAVAEQMPDTFRLASFNLESLDEAPGSAVTVEDRIAALRPQLRRLDADILCLQEVNSQRGSESGTRHLYVLDRLLEGTAYAGYERAISLGLKGQRLADHHNLVILSRWPIRRWRSLRHDLVPPPLVRPVTADPPCEAPQPVEWDRPLLHARVALPANRQLEVINLHLRAPLASPIAGQREGPLVWKSCGGWAEGFYLSELKRSGQALEARMLVDSLIDEHPDALVAVCGDCNTNEDGTSLRLLRASVEDTGSGALASRELVALARSIPEDRRFSVLHGGQGALYDHMLVSRELYAAFRQVELHNEALAEEGAVGPATPFSFHAPLVAEFDSGRLSSVRSEFSRDAEWDKGIAS